MSMTKAMLWLHLKRAVRYKYGLINWGIIEFLYMAIYMLGALAFTPRDQWGGVSQYVFWGVLAWTLVSTPTWTIGNWAQFYINMGLWEQHETIGASHSLFLSMRIIPAIIAGFIGSITAYGFLYATVGGNLSLRGSVLLTLLFLLWLVLQSTIYGLLLSYLSLLTSTPGPMLDVLNILLFIIGGIGVPVAKLPEGVRLFAVITPYSHASELIRWSAIGIKPYLGVLGEVFAGVLTTLGLGLTAWLVRGKAYSNARMNGVKGIGRM
ncbi:MAG: ABC transporter permease [Desulfurococcales archaeon]|nr:ABC transporter permease [Desulfurococcales archaeon]